MGGEYGYNPGAEEEERKSRARNGFIKKTAAFLGALAIGSGVGEVINTGLANQETKELIDSGTARVIDKTHTPLSSSTMVVRKIPINNVSPESWRLTISFDNNIPGGNPEDQTKYINVTKAQFDNYKVGDNLPVTYRLTGNDAGMSIDAVEINDGK